MKILEKSLHSLFFGLTFIYLGVITFYQVFSDQRYASLKNLRYREPRSSEAITVVDSTKIKVVCEPICFFLADGKKIRSRTDSDAGGGLTNLELRFYDSYYGLIGYEDKNEHPNFFVIDTRGELLQMVRLKLDKNNFSFAAYYPGIKLIEFKASNGQKFFYAADQPALKVI